MVDPNPDEPPGGERASTEGTSLPPEAPERTKPGTSAAAAVLGLLTLAMLTFFLCSVITVAKRWANLRGPEPEAAAQAAEPTEEPTAATTGALTSGVRRGRATVVVPPGRGPGVLRTSPAFDAPRAAFIPNGTPVDVVTIKNVPKGGLLQSWCQVRANVGGKDVEGWMHSDILKQ